MKHTLSALILLACTLTAPAQKVSKRFNYACELMEAKQYDSALYIFRAIYNKGIGAPPLISKSYYNMAISYLELKDSANAKRIFTDIVQSDFDDMDAGGTGSGLMAEPYALYKNRSCNMLVVIALQEQDFKTALKYTEMADKQYPYVHFCGNEYAAHDIYMARMYGRCYAGLGQKDKAIEVLLPQSMTNGMASNEKLVNQLCALIKEKYTQDEIQRAVALAISGMFTRKISKRDPDVYYVKMFGTEFPLDPYGSVYGYYTDNKLKGIELAKYRFQESPFVKALLQH